MHPQPARLTVVHLHSHEYAVSGEEPVVQLAGEIGEREGNTSARHMHAYPYAYGIRLIPTYVCTHSHELLQAIAELNGGVAVDDDAPSF